MHRAGLTAKEVPGRVMSGGSLRDLVAWAGLYGVDQIGELDGILDEEYGDVVTNNI